MGFAFFENGTAVSGGTQREIPSVMRQAAPGFGLADRFLAAKGVPAAVKKAQWAKGALTVLNPRYAATNVAAAAKKLKFW